MHKKLLFLFLFICIGGLCSAQVDTTIGLTAPKSISRDYNALAAFLCFDQTGDQAKANAVYNWVTHNISYDIKAVGKIPRHHDKIVERTLKSRKAVCEGYAKVFTEICRAAGLKAVNIDGYAKDWIFDDGDELYIPRHMWCAVQINGKWQFADPTWGAGGLVQSPTWLRRQLNKISRHKVMYAKRLKFKFKYDPQYFMQNPQVFRFKHLPTDPLWQLSDSTMPIQVFEAGDSAIKLFNEKYSKPKQSDAKLLQIADFDERQRVFESADRAYAYNPRYVAALAFKQSNRAVAILEKAFTDTTLQNADLLIKDASQGLAKSDEYIKEQKKAFPDEYNKLKKKNKTKGQAAKQHIRQIKNDDKKRIAQCKKYTNAVGSKYNRIKKKSADIQKKQQGTYAGKINDVALAKVQKKTGSPELLVIKDSIAARNTRIAGTQQEITTQKTFIQLNKEQNEKRLDSLATALSFEDSMLLHEAIARLNMHDSYDDEVKIWSEPYKAIKSKTTDSVQKRYYAGFDTITTAHDKLQKLQAAQADLYKKNLSSMEQYKKWNESDNSLPDNYAACYTDYTAAIDSQKQDLAAYTAYIKGNKKIFAKLTKLGQRQMKIAGFMEKAEENRKMLEEKTIVKDQAFDLKENKRQRAQLKEMKTRVDKIGDKLN